VWCNEVVTSVGARLNIDQVLPKECMCQWVRRAIRRSLPSVGPCAEGTALGGGEAHGEHCVHFQVLSARFGPIDRITL